jgi:hypothetical protein
MRPLIISPTLNVEIASCGGMLAKFAGELVERKSEEGTIIDVRERARLLYINLRDYVDLRGKHISLNNQVAAIKEASDMLESTWECMYWGRKHANLSRIDEDAFREKLKKRINFYKPTHIFFQESSRTNPSNVAMVGRHIVDIVRHSSFTITMYTYNPDSIHGLYYPFGEYYQEEKLCAHSAISNLSDSFDSKETIKTRDSYRGELVGLPRAEVFKPINIITKSL